VTATRTPDVARAGVEEGGRLGAPLRLRDGTAVWLRGTGPRDPCDERAEIVAEESRGLAVGRSGYTRVYGPRAALTLDVADPYWQRGLPAALLAVLGRRAATGGISTFMIRVPVVDERLLELLADGCGARLSREGLHLDVEFAVAAPARLVRSFTDPEAHDRHRNGRRRRDTGTQAAADPR
jgi:hypothetical protein